MIKVDLIVGAGMKLMRRYLSSNFVAMLVQAFVLISIAVTADTVAAQSAQSPATIEEIVVRADASLVERMGSIGSRDSLTGDEVARIGATHINETLSRVAGVWISRGSGQEHLTAIRSPVYTGAGACGEFLFLEDGVPIRPAGFCNLNNLFEVNSEQVGGIEVWRGPSSAVLGGNALHGAINVLSALPDSNSISLEGGPYDYYRVAGQAQGGSSGGQQWGVSVNGASSNGYRDDTGYGQQKASFIHLMDVGDWAVRSTLNMTLLNQETGAFVNGFEAYEDDDLKDSNPSPQAYRDAWSLRGASHWSRGPWQLVPYVRRSAMEFLQHFLPGQPRENNDQTSFGVLGEYEWAARDDLNLSFGAQLEYMQGSLQEYQEDALTTSSAFNNNVRNQGTHYDFDVDSLMVAAFLNVNWELTDTRRLVHSLRFENIEYDYDNKALDGNTRDDGSTCGFGGCLYLRTPDSKDDFDNVAVRLGLEQDFSFGTGYVVVATGFRPPQVTELYRLQRNQAVTDLDSEEVVSLEVGMRGAGWSIAAFSEKTSDLIFRDAAGLNVSDGKTKSIGVEFSVSHTWDRHTVALNGIYAEHRYDFTGGASGGEAIEDGNLVDTAPRWLANARWRMQATDQLDSEFEVNYNGKHYINAANTAKYEGHVVVNWRGRYTLNDSTTIFARVVNLFDEEYADRADFTIFNPLHYRYFPAMPRQLYLGVKLDF